MLDSISFSINAGERLGLVGPNGAGKSTLIAAIAGQIRPDSGSVMQMSGADIGYLPQGALDIADGTLGDLLDGPLGGLLTAASQLDAVTATLAIDSAPSTLDALEAATASFEAAGGYGRLAALEQWLDRFELEDVPLATPLAQLSGGQKTRAGLAALLTREPDLLLLDEPTNHLDVDALAWLEQFVMTYRGAVLLVSHDRAFMDAVVTDILHLDPETHRLTRYAGTFSDAVRKQEAARVAQADLYHRQQAEIERISADIRSVASNAQRTERSTNNDHERRLAKKVAKTAKVRERKLEKMLESAEMVEKPKPGWSLAMDLDHVPHSGRDVVRLDHVRAGYGETVVLDDVDLIIRSGERVVITGPNGAGKSTLMRLIAGTLEPLSGTVVLGANVQRGIFTQEQEAIDLGRSAVELVRDVTPVSASDARTFLHKFLFSGDDATRPSGQLSYGERSRLALALLVAGGANLLLLDEPLNHLDVTSRERFEAALLGFTGTIIAVLHDRYAIQRIATRVLDVRGGAVREKA